MKKIKISLLALFLVAVACKDNKQKKYLPESIGAINNVAVVIDNDLWKGKVGDKIREHFAAPVLGLSWDESSFTLNQMNSIVFTGTLRKTRSVVFVQKDTVNIGHVKSDLYATPQKIGVFKGRTEDEIIQNIEAKAAEAIKAFKEVEISEAQKRFQRSLNKETVLDENFGISLQMPSAYRVGQQEDNFVWIDRQIPKGNMNIIAYTLPYDSFSNEATFVADILRKKDSIGKLYIPGTDVPNKVTYMKTEKIFAPYIVATEIGGKKAVEVKGIWEIHNYPMAGPYVSYIINDAENNRKIVIEGFVFAPQTRKRDYMFELESIIKTVTFN
ncbi:MAG: DUF4837 family protein [Cellulophaga sp.]